MSLRSALRCTFRLGLAFSLSLLGAPTVAEPFGVSPETDTPESLGCFPDQGTYYNCLTLPQPHSDIYYYKLQYDQSLGYCMFMGVGFEVPTKSSGDELKAVVERVAAFVAESYGPGTKVDVIDPSSQLQRSRDFMKSLLAEERSYGWLWELPAPVESVVGIAVVAYAISETTGNIVVEFHTPASTDCDALDRAATTR